MTPSLTRRTAAVALAALVLAAPVNAQQSMLCTSDGLDLSQSDASRLDNMFVSRTRGLGSAASADSTADRDTVASLFQSGLAPVDADLLPGAYDCRTIKMGGNLPLVVYQWFRCEIGQEDATLTIRKVTGSQNFFGTLEPQGAVYAYRGAGTYGREDQVRLYGDDPERNQVGCLSAVTKGNRHFVLELPFPMVESHHDVIELRPAD